MYMYRQGESEENTVLTITGSQTFSLEMAEGQLSNLHLDHGGELHCSELGFTTRRVYSQDYSDPGREGKPGLRPEN